MFDWLPFVGGDTERPEETTFDSDSGEDVVVEGNHEAWGVDVTVSAGDPSGVLDAQWFGSRTIEFEQPDSEDDADSRPQHSPEGATVEPLGSDVVRPPSTAPTSNDATEGEFGLPLQPDFVRQLELAAKNGAHERVETGYVLAGTSDTIPNVVFGLDDACLYLESTDRTLNPRIRSIARRVAAAYPQNATPDLVVWVHTHPHKPDARPSDQDRSGNDRLKDCFADAFGTDSFRLRQGIHAYDRRPEDPTLGRRHRPITDKGAFAWQGEQYRHTLRVWDYRFQQPLQPEVITRD